MERRWTMGELSMSREEREQFLMATHVGIVSIADDERAPLSVPVWYRYEPGGVVCFVTGGDSKKATLLRKAGRATFVVQTETPPYKYVTIEGPVTIEREFDWAREVEEVAYRYLGRELGKAYLAMSADDYASTENVLVSLAPERWASADFTKMLPGA
jgi:nitroimidazol reductase NimA-like FMN-containing flavoprotein (pyridoxamine 5'-phosphate oxidase superfamily)